MTQPITKHDTSDTFELHYNESYENIIKKPSFSSPSLIFFKDIWKVRCREKTKQFFIMYILGLGISCALIAIDMMTFNTIDDMKHPFVDVYSDPYKLLYISVYSEDPLLLLSPQKSQLAEDINNFFNSTYHFTFDVKNSMKEMKNILSSESKNGIGVYLEDNGDSGEKSIDISMINKNSDYLTQLSYLSFLKFIVENETMMNDKESLKSEVNYAKLIENIDDFNDNNSVFINISSKIYAHPEMKPPVAYESLTAFYVILGFFFVTIASSSVVFKLNKEKILFYLKINGLNDFMLYTTLVLSSLLETIPCTAITSLAAAYIPYSLRGTNFWIVLISTFLLSLGRTFFNLLSETIFLKFDSFGFYFIFILLPPVVFLLLSMYRQKIPNIVFVIFSLLSPSQAYMQGFSIMTKCKSEIGPLTFSLVNTKFNGFSMIEVFCYQICNTIIMLLFMIIFMMNMDHLFGHAAIGWRNIFKKEYWSRAFNSYRKNRVSDDTTTENQIALKLQDVKKTYKGHVKVQALKGVNCEINSKESIVLLGPNGSGKSTLIDCIVGTNTIDSGLIQFFGTNLNKDYSLIHDNLGIVFQDNVLFNELTVDEHFEIIGSLHRIPKEKVYNDTFHLMSLFLMSDSIKSRSGDLSGGQKRKLCMALALLHKPPFLIFDEPTAGVDAQSRQIIWKVLSLHNDDSTSLITSHAIEEAESICSRLFIMSNGSVQFIGTPTELRREANCGYILTVIEDDNNDNITDILLDFIKKRIPDAEKLDGKEKSVIFTADLRAADVLDDIEKSKESLGIVKYAIKIQNLEESLVKFIQNEEVNQL